jgi:hypothetical protein
MCVEVSYFTSMLFRDNNTFSVNHRVNYFALYTGTSSSALSVEIW